MARGRKSSLRIALSPEERTTLQHWQRSTTIAAGLARRGRIILLLAAGHSQSDVAQVVGVQRPVVRKWAKRFLAQRLEGLADAPGRGAKGAFSPPRWPSTWCDWPASAPIRWVAASRNGIAKNWRASSSRRGAWRTSPPRRCGGFCARINSSPGAVMTGSTPRSPGTPRSMPRSPSSSISIPARCMGVRWSSPWMKRPPSSRVPVSTRLYRPSRRTCPTSASTSTSAPGP